MNLDVTCTTGGAPVPGLPEPEAAGGDVRAGTGALGERRTASDKLIATATLLTSHFSKTTNEHSLPNC